VVSAKDGLHDGEDVVGGPGDQEDEEDEGKCLCCFSLLLLFLRRFLDLILARQRVMSGTCSLVGGLLDTLRILFRHDPRGGADIPRCALAQGLLMLFHFPFW